MPNVRAEGRAARAGVLAGSVINVKFILRNGKIEDRNPLIVERAIPVVPRAGDLVEWLVHGRHHWIVGRVTWSMEEESETWVTVELGSHE